MTEMAPEGYVGVSPKCILGFNKVSGETNSIFFSNKRIPSENLSYITNSC